MLSPEKGSNSNVWLHLGIDQACGASPQSNWGSPRVFCLHQQQLV
jgi:hypothetical protein